MPRARLWHESWTWTWSWDDGSCQVWTVRSPLNRYKGVPCIVVVYTIDDMEEESLMEKEGKGGLQTHSSLPLGGNLQNTA